MNETVGREGWGLIEKIKEVLSQGPDEEDPLEGPFG